MSVVEAADALGVSTRTVRRWAAAGEAIWRDVQVAAGGKLPTAADVHARLADSGSEPPGSALGTCLLVPPATGRRRRFEIPAEEVERLRSQRRAPSTRQGYDVVFRPAKGWSVLWAVGPDEVRHELRRIHHQAVDDALAYLEDTAARGRATVRWAGRTVRVRARGDGFAAACFDHRESRAGDPLLHTHCLIANVTRLPDGQLGALEASALFRQQRAADAVYRATFLRLATERLGIRPAPGDDPFPEPDGVPRAVVEHFSKRSHEINQAVARHGSTSAAARQLAALATRRAKEVAARSDDLHDRWRREAATVGFGPAQVAACLGRPPVSDPAPADLEALERTLASPDGLTGQSATFVRGEVIQAIATALPGAMTGPDVVRAANRFLASDAVIQVREHRPGRPRGRVLEAEGVVDDLALCRFSVPELAETEARLIAAANRSSGPTVSESTLAAVLARFEHLSGEQAQMVRAVCRSPRLLRPVVGLPGSGKTTAASALVAACRAAALPVVGCAVTATAAHELGQRTGIPSDTLARTLLDLQSPDGQLAPGSVVITDEASMLPTRALHELVTHVEAAGGAAVLIGDPHQHPAVGPGSFFTWLTARHETPTLIGNLRQTGPHADVEREAAAALRAGDVAASVRLRDEAGLLIRSSTPSELHEELVADWARHWTKHRDPMIAPSNETRERLNQAARALLANAGVLAGPALLTSAGREFQQGDWVVARHNDRRLRADDGSRFWVRNGATGEIVTIDHTSGDVVVDFVGHNRRHRVRLPAAYADEHLEHGYALTDYGVQGRTLTRSLAVLEAASTTPGAYVATTRGRTENRLYIAAADEIDHAALDVSHGIPTLTAPTLQELAARVAARRPDGMLHDRDPHVRAASELAARSDSASLGASVSRLDAMIGEAPVDHTRALESALAARGSLIQRLVNTSRSSDASRWRDKASEKLARRLSHLDAVIERLERHQVHRRATLARREVLFGQRAIVGDALALRTSKDRLIQSAGQTREKAELGHAQQNGQGNAPMQR